MGFFRKKLGKDDKSTYYYIWKGPERQEDGSLIYKRFERSTGTGDRRLAEKKAKLFECEAYEVANRLVVKKDDAIPFAEAAVIYLKGGGSGDHLTPILERIGDKPVTDIDQSEVLNLCEELKPGTKPATWNRCVFTPILAVINHAASLKKCPLPVLQRPRGHNEAPPLEIPDERWFELVVKHAKPKTRACILILTLHGLRVSEAIKRVPSDVDPIRWTLTIPHTKTGEPVLVRLSAPVIEAIEAIPKWRTQKWLFGSCHRSNLHKRVSEACRRVEAELKEEDPDACVRAFGSHAYGRHSFASRLLSSGFSLKFVQDAGRWKTSKMVAERYGHLEQSEVEAASNQAGAEWARDVLKKVHFRVKVVKVRD